MCTQAGTKFSSLLCKTCPNKEFSDTLSEDIVYSGPTELWPAFIQAPLVIILLP